MTKNRLSFLRLFLFSYIVVALHLGAVDAVAQEPVAVIDVELAKFVGADYLPKYYPGKWEFFNLFTCYDLDGIPAAYVVVFHKAGSSIVTLEKMNAALKKIRTKRDKIRGEITQIEESDDVSEDVQREKLEKLKGDANRQTRASYLSDTFATVITGATETSPSIIRCYRGLPSFLVQREDVEAELKVKYPGRSLQMRTLVYFGPGDIRYEVKEETVASAGKKGTKIVRKQIADSSHVVRLREGKRELGKVSVEREKVKKRKAEKEASKANMTAEVRAQDEESEAKRKKHLQDKWKRFRHAHNEARLTNAGGLEL